MKLKRTMIAVDPEQASVPEVHHLLLGGVAPRPIALVSTISKSGINNLSPFSFFNAFGANPPYVAFSPARRGRDASLKDTYNNLVATKECVIQAVTYNMVHQTSLASTEFGPEVDEFTRSGFTPIPSELVRPMRVAESPFQMECKLEQMIALGGDKASGNLAICRVIRFHVDEAIMVDGRIDPHLADLVARNGGDYYTRAAGGAIFSLPKPTSVEVIGYDNLPEVIKESQTLSASNLGQLASCKNIPSNEDVDSFRDDISANSGDSEYVNMLASAWTMKDSNRDQGIRSIEDAARLALHHNDTDFAWKALLLAESLRNCQDR